MNEEQRFWSKVDKRDEDECWNWQGAVDGKGYGAFWSAEQRKQIIASRMSYVLENGTIPSGAIICHKCDNPKCVNPKHLYAGTHADNMKDKVDRNRQNAPRGERQGSAKLNREEIMEIRRMKNEGKTLAYIADKFSISFQHVSDIVHLRRWGWLTGE
jgi:hypothetical protein